MDQVVFMVAVGKAIFWLLLFSVIIVRALRKRRAMDQGEAANYS
jgi:hypothetical protein